MNSLYFAAMVASLISSSSVPLQYPAGWVTSNIVLDGNSSHTFATGSENVSWIDHFASALDTGWRGFGISLNADASGEWDGVQSPWGVKSIHVGKCSVNFTWNAGANNLPKPTKALLRVFSSVGASLIRDGDVQVANGLGSPVVDDSYDVRTTKSSTGKRIAYFENTDPTFSLTGILAAAIGPVSQMYSHASAGFSFDISAIPYPRLVPYERIQANYRADGNGGRIQNLPNANGEHALDLAGTSFQDPHTEEWLWQGSVGIRLSGSIYEQEGRTWSCSSNVISVAPPTPQGSTYSEWLINLGNGNADFGSTDWTVKLEDLGDNQNPEVPVLFAVKWHKPYENPFTVVGPLQTFQDGLVREIEGDGWPPTTVKVTWEQPGANAYLAQQVGSAFEKISDLGIPIVSIITGWIGGGIAVFAPEVKISHVPNDAVSSGLIWSAPGSQHLPDANQIPRERYQMRNPIPHVESIFQVWLAEAYDTVVGYKGREFVAFNNPSGYVYFSATFQHLPLGRASNPNGTD